MRKDKTGFVASMIREFSPNVIRTSREQFITFQATLMRTGLTVRDNIYLIAILTMLVA